MKTGSGICSLLHGYIVLFQLLLQDFHLVM